MAHVLGYPSCDTQRFVTDPEFGTLLPNASYLVPKANLTPPMEQYTNMYPFRALPHQESLNSGIPSCKNIGAPLVFALHVKTLVGVHVLALQCWTSPWKSRSYPIQGPCSMSDISSCLCLQRPGTCTTR